MNLLLTGNFDTAERDTWAAALRQALPGHRLCLARGEVADDQIDAAIVANPSPGQLQGLPRAGAFQRDRPTHDKDDGIVAARPNRGVEDRSRVRRGTDRRDDGIGDPEPIGSGRRVGEVGELLGEGIVPRL